MKQDECAGIVAAPLRQPVKSAPEGNNVVVVVVVLVVIGLCIIAIIVGVSYKAIKQRHLIQTVEIV